MKGKSELILFLHFLKGFGPKGRLHRGELPGVCGGRVPLWAPSVGGLRMAIPGHKLLAEVRENSGTFRHGLLRNGILRQVLVRHRRVHLYVGRAGRGRVPVPGPGGHPHRGVRDLLRPGIPGRARGGVAPLLGGRPGPPL